MRWLVLAVAFVVGLLSIQPAEAGITERIWRLEKRKNAWLKKTFIERDWRFPRIFRRG